MNTEPKLVSFVLRFVYDEVSEGATPGEHGTLGWYGIVRHVQSNSERHFTRWEDVSAFVAQYVDLRKEAQDG
ncbi:MAG TPA: hypothetical protein VFR15_12050 [Chloroflexia bacterium]|nr:hypothetical protein [Chloroflexia bacterium]